MVATPSKSSELSTNSMTSISHQPSQPATADDDPKSELNMLRREVRQLQAAVRDAALQITAQQEEISTLRESLATAESEAEESLSREASLHVQLHQQRLKRERVESTMQAAEALLAALHEMVLESPPQSSSDRLIQEYPPAATSSPKDSPNDTLDLLLSRIEPISGSAATVDVKNDVSTSVAHDSPPMLTSGASPTIKANLSSPMTELPSPIKQTKELVSEPADTSSLYPSSMSIISKDTILHQRSASIAMALPVQQTKPLRPHSQSSPNSPVCAPSALLLSAFGQKSGADAAQAPAVHASNVQSGDPLPSEVATIANSDAVVRSPSIIMLPSAVSYANNYAHGGEIFAMTSSLESSWFASGGDDKTVKLYDHVGKQYASIGGMPKSVTAVALYPDAQANADCPIVYAGAGDGSIRCFKRASKRKTKWSLASVFPVHTQPVRQLLLSDAHGFSSSSGLILTCSTDRTIKISDIESSKRPFSVATPSAVLDVASFGTNGEGLLVSGHKDGGIRLWSAREQESTVGGAKIHSKPITSISCLEDGYGIVSLGRDNSLKLCDIRMDTSVVREFEGGVQSVSDWHRATVNGRYIACGLGKTGHLGIWSVDTGKLVRRVSSQAPTTDGDVLNLVARKLRSPSCVLVPHWTKSGQFVCAHQSNQVSFWTAS